MKILLVAPQYNQFKDTRAYYHLPLGLMYISSYLKSKGFDIRCLNLNHYKMDRLDEVLKKDAFDVVATGGFFIHLREIESVLKRVRLNSPKAKIILGGALASGDPEFVLQDVKPDYLVLGEGELTAEMLLRAIERKEGVSGVTGIAYMRDGRFVKTPPTPTIGDLDALPYPDYEGFEYSYYLDNFPAKNYEISAIRTLGEIQNRRLAQVISSRDCVAKCTFCYRLLGGKYRLRSIAEFIKEIQFLIQKYGVNDLSLADDLFSARAERVLEFCRRIKPLRISWHCQLRVSVISEELLRTMKEAGCYLVSYGFESASQTVLNSMKKGIRVAQIEKAIELTHKSKMTIQGNFIFGDPAETLDTFWETYKFSRKHRATELGFGMVVPYPGTVLYHDLVARGKIKNIRKFHLNSSYPPVNMTKMSEIDFLFLYRRVGLETVMRHTYAKLTSVEEISKGLFRISAICPSCSADNRDFHLEVVVGGKYVVVCRECYRRFSVDSTDSRFGDPWAKLKPFFRVNSARIILFNPLTHRILFYPVKAAIALRNSAANAFRKLARSSS